MLPSKYTAVDSIIDRRTDLLKIFLDRGANPVKNKSRKNSLLMIAVQESNAEAIDLICNRVIRGDLHQHIVIILQAYNMFISIASTNALFRNIQPRDIPTADWEPWLEIWDTLLRRLKQPDSEKNKVQIALFANMAPIIHYYDHKISRVYYHYTIRTDVLHSVIKHQIADLTPYVLPISLESKIEIFIDKSPLWSDRAILTDCLLPQSKPASWQLIFLMLLKRIIMWL